MVQPYETEPINLSKTSNGAALRAWLMKILKVEFLPEYKNPSLNF